MRIRRFFLNCIALFTSGASYAAHFAVVLQPIPGEHDLIGKHPEASQSIRSVLKYESAMEEMRSVIGPELELITSRILAPAKEFQSVMKLVRKSITKRDHKVRSSPFPLTYIVLVSEWCLCNFSSLITIGSITPSRSFGTRKRNL